MNYLLRMLDKFADGFSAGGGFVLGVWVLWHLLVP